MSNSAMKMFAGASAATLLIGLTAGVGAQAANPDPVPQQQASLPDHNAPSIPLGRDDVREVQNQLISLGFNPGPADGEAGPGTMAAVQQYDQSRGGPGRVSIDRALLERLKADTGKRLTYEQVAERSRAHAASAPAASSSSAASNQFGGIVQQIVPLIGAAIANSNNNNYGPGYYGPGPGYYGPPPGYYGYGYGGY